MAVPQGAAPTGSARRTVSTRFGRIGVILGIAAGTVLTGAGPAFADGVSVPVPPVTLQEQLPPVGDGCTETPDTGWVCPPDTSDPVGYAVDNTVGPGALPGATDPNAYVVDPLQASAKELFVALTAATVAENLATGVTESPPSDGDIPTSPDPHQPPGSQPPDKYGVGYSGYGQGDHPWCVGAATATMLSTFKVGSDVASVESAEGWRSGDAGTPMGNARPYLNNHQNAMYYMYDAAGSAAQLFSHASDDIWGYGAPMMIAAGTRGLWWWKDSPTQGLHALTIVAYYSQSNGGFRVWDSNGNYGANSISLADTWAAMGMANAGDAEIW
jgi:hypothetical protein